MRELYLTNLRDISARSFMRAFNLYRRSNLYLQ